MPRIALFAPFVRGISVNLIDQGVRLVGLFLTTPLMIRCLGKDEYGNWLFALAIIGYLKLLDLGISLAGTRFLATTVGNHDHREYASLTIRLFRLYVWISVFSLLSTALAVLILPNFLEGSGHNHIRLLILGFGLATSVRFLTRIFEVSLKSHVRYDLLGASALIRTITQTGLSIFLLTRGHGVIALLILHIATDIVEQILYVNFALRLTKKIKFSDKPEGSIGNGQLIKFSAYSIACSAGQTLRAGLDPIIITGVASVATLPFYNVGTRALGVVSDFINILFGGNLMAALSQLRGCDGTSASRSFLQSVRICTMASSIAGCGLVIFGPSFIQRWVGPEFSISSLVLCILAPGTALAYAQYPVWAMLYSINKQLWVAVFNLSGGVLNLILSLYLATRLGWLGVVWGSLIETIISFGIVTPWMVSRFCGIRAFEFYAIIGKAALWVLLGSFGFWAFTRHLIAPSYIRIAFLGSMYVFFVTGIVYFLALSTEERKYFTRFARAWRK